MRRLKSFKYHVTPRSRGAGRRPSSARFHRPSAAMSVALLALFVAVGGTSYAGVRLANNSVLSRTIKNGQVKRQDLARNAVGSAQVADGSLLASDFKSGQLKAGPAGPQGLQGPQGPKGDKGDTGLTSLTVRAVSGTGPQTVDCQPGERATGGGVHSVDGVITASAPVSNTDAIFTNDPPVQNYTPTAWTGDAFLNETDHASVTVWVICARP